MIITALSDNHGYLPKIEKTDLLLIAGDWSPLEIQTDAYYMRQWLDECLMHWFKEIPAEKIIFIAGNHDFICDQRFLEIPLLNAQTVTFEKDIVNPLLKKHKLTNKVKYLCNSSTTYNGLKIYGCPYVESLRGWAFSQAEYTTTYLNIKKCDILITHQPPLIGDLGKCVIKGISHEFGSYGLLNAVIRKRPKLAFCGHIHDGNHKPVIYNHNDGTITQLFNVAIKDDNYDIVRKPIVINF
jgi:Icc-related predicted phosphoesterase